MSLYVCMYVYSTSSTSLTDLIINLTFRKLFLQENGVTKELVTESYIMPVKRMALDRSGLEL